MIGKKVPLPARLVIEVSCEHRNNVGACEVGTGIHSCHCLHCPLGPEWTEEHVSVIAEDTAWGNDASDMIHDAIVKRIIWKPEKRTVTTNKGGK